MSRKNTKGTILAIDMGNTNIVIGCVDDDKVIFEERLSTDLSKTELEYAISFKNVLEIYNIKSEDINGAIISSVVPQLVNVIKAAVEKVVDIEPLVVGPGVKTGLNILMDQPKQVGSDPQRHDLPHSVGQRQVGQDDGVRRGGDGHGAVQHGSLPADGRGGTRAPDESADDSGFPVELDVPLRLPAAFAVRQTCGRQAVCGVFRTVGRQFPRGERQGAAVHERLGAGVLRGGRLSARAVRHQPPSVPHRVHQGGCGVEFVGSGGNRQLGELPGASSAHIGAHRRPAEFLRRGDDADGGTAGDVSGTAGSGMGVCGDDDGAGAADSRLRGIE